MSKAILVGITGGIGSGKSMVSRLLRLKGYRVYDCDSEAKRLMNADARMQKGIKDIFGPESVDEVSGCVNREIIAASAFADKEKLLRLNALVHKEVASHLDSTVEKCGQPCMFVESAILYTSGLASKCRRVWMVEAPHEERLARAMNRDGVEENRIRERMKMQEEETALAQRDPGKCIIANDGHRSVISQVDSLLETI